MAAGGERPENARALRALLARARDLRFSKRAQQRLSRLVSICGSLPECAVQLAGERHLAFAVRGKTFAYYLNDHHSDGRVGLCCKSSVSLQQALMTAHSSRYYVPAYLGIRGWVSLRLDESTIDWNEVLAVLIRAYRMQAPAHLAAEMS